MIVDMFAVNRFVIFLRCQYPEIELRVVYDIAYFELTVTIYPKKHGLYDTFAGKAIVYETEKAIEVINTFFINYLAELSVMGVKL